MRNNDLKRWMVWGGLALGAWAIAGCGMLPQQAGNDSFSPGFTRSYAQAGFQSGYNGTIQDIPTSIDPRTPEKEGTPGRSLTLDLGERVMLQQQRSSEQGYGGSGLTLPDSAAGYRPLGREGSGVIAPINQGTAAQSYPQAFPDSSLDYNHYMKLKVK